MKKRRINRDYLNSILSIDVKNTKLTAEAVAITLREFAQEHLKGVLTVEVSGYSRGEVSLKLPVFSYLIRLLCEEVEDEPVKCSVSLGEELVIETSYPKINDMYKTSHLIKVAKLAGFKVDRVGDVLIFKAKADISAIMQVYATSYDELMRLLVTTYNM